MCDLDDILDDADLPVHGTRLTLMESRRIRMLRVSARCFKHWTKRRWSELQESMAAHFPEQQTVQMMLHQILLHPFPLTAKIHETTGMAIRALQGAPFPHFDVEE